jgi:hypothetical protein
MSNPINIIGTAALAIGITFYPNPWLIFLPVALFLSEWLVFPTSIFNAANLGMTDTNVQFVVTAVQAAVGVILALAFISWYKGQETI